MGKARHNISNWRQYNRGAMVLTILGNAISCCLGKAVKRPTRPARMRAIGKKGIRKTRRLRH